MFRTIIKRSSSLRSAIRGSVRLNAIRVLSVQAIKKNLPGQCVLHRQPLKTWSNYHAMRHYSSKYPEHLEVALPALSPTMEEGTVISWNKKEGDKLNEGDMLAEIETDKATMAFETPEEGFLAKILVPAGTKHVPVGKLICIIVEEEANIAAFKDYTDTGAPAKAPAAPSAPTPPTPTPGTPPMMPPTPQASAPVVDTGSSRTYASPMARRLAEQRNIRLQGKGTGLFDSITSSDLDKMSSLGGPTGLPMPPPMPTPTFAATPGAVFADTPISNIRAVIAKRLLQSKQSIPHYYLVEEVNVDKLIALRAKFNKKLEKSGVRLSVNDFIIKALAHACTKVPEANSHWMDSVIRQYKNVDVSVAVSTDRGLITPIIHEANNKGLITISKEMKSLAAKAREGKLQPHEFQGGTISLSNLGMLGIDHFSAIINPPQSCILAVGTTKQQLVLDESSEKGFRVANFMSVTLSCDHRVVDGAVGAHFLQAFQEVAQDPQMMIL